MRLRSKREPRTEQEPSQLMVAGEDEVESTTSVSWTVEQLNALGPVIGPSHRTFVPIVRSAVPNILLGDPMDTSVPRLQS
jgi:hypothetical protein